MVTTLYTRGLARPSSVFGERTKWIDGDEFRTWEPSRSKLAAALMKGFEASLPNPEDVWLYLGAANGNTASFVADLVGPRGKVFAVDKSARTVARLLAVAEKYPNIYPILGDARFPLNYLGWVPPADGLYVDVAQPDQVEICLENAAQMLKTTGVVLLALKTASMGRTQSARDHLEASLQRIRPLMEVESTTSLEPYHRGHFLIVARPTRKLFQGTAAS